MRAIAQMDPVCLKPEEQDKLHTDGPYKGSFFINGPEVDRRTLPEGSQSIAEGYLQALRELIASDSRIGEGHAFNISII